jgi:hypothetical protein
MKRNFHEIESQESNGTEITGEASSHPNAILQQSGCAFRGHNRGLPAHNERVSDFFSEAAKFRVASPHTSYPACQHLRVEQIFNLL